MMEQNSFFMDPNLLLPTLVDRHDKTVGKYDTIYASVKSLFR